MTLRESGEPPLVDSEESNQGLRLGPRSQNQPTYDGSDSPETNNITKFKCYIEKNEN